MEGVAEFAREASVYDFVQLSGPDGIIRPHDASGVPNEEAKDFAPVWKEMNRDFNDSMFHKHRSYTKPMDNYEPYSGAPEKDSDAPDFEDRPVSEAWKLAKAKKEKAEAESDGCD